MTRREQMSREETLSSDADARERRLNQSARERMKVRGRPLGHLAGCVEARQRMPCRRGPGPLSLALSSAPPSGTTVALEGLPFSSIPDPSWRPSSGYLQAASRSQREE